MNIWNPSRQLAGNTIDRLGTVLGLGEGNVSEWIAGGNTVNTNRANASSGQVLGSTTQQNSSQMSNQNYTPWNGTVPNKSQTTTPQPSSTSGGQPSSSGGSVNTVIQQGVSEQQGAANDAANARKAAAYGRYEAQKGIAEEAKSSAGDQYNWLVDTLGSNKKDLLSQVALNETEGMQNYQMQQEKTQKDYDGAKQEILSTYRDLQLQQEKILRGSGMSSSSRSQEAALRLNNLLGKDLSTVRTNEADSLAMIGNAISSFKEKITLSKNQIETQTKSELDKAALDYDSQIKAINANLTLSAQDREDAIAAAESQLAADSQAISQWATNLKLQAEEVQAANQGVLDNFIADMLDENGMLNADLGTKRQAVNDVITKSGFTALDTNASVANPTVGVYQNANMTYKDKDSLDAALAAGQITPQQYQAQLSQIQSASVPVPGVSQTNTPSTLATNTGVSAQRDPLLGALFA